MKTAITYTILGLCLFTTDVFSSDSMGAFQAYTRESMSLNGKWKVIVDPYQNGFYNYRYKAFDDQAYPPPAAYFTDSKMASPTDLIEYDFDKAETLMVPSAWNTQKEKLYYYEGSVWYRKKFDAPEDTKDGRAFLYFGAANYKSDVYLNGKKLGVHEGGFTPFFFEVSDLLRDKGNSVVVKVDNSRHADAVPTLNTDWWNYGGITRDVKLLVVPPTFIRDYKIELSSLENKTIAGYVQLDGAQGKEKIKLRIPELKKEATIQVNKNGFGKFEINLPVAQLWSPESPKLYDIEFQTRNDRLTDKVGFRKIETQGKKLLLNGEPIFLRGISIHDEYVAEGGARVSTPEDAKKLLGWAKELNCNFVRLAHYPHNEHTVRQAEKMGLLVWSEIPVYWTINWQNEDTYRNAEKQLEAMIHRDKNRAAVIIWSIANETPVSEARNKFLAGLASKARSLDDTRLLSAAMEIHYENEEATAAVVEDPLADLTDIVSFNQYIGWYDGLPEKASRVTWRVPYDKPVFVSEFGGGAKAGYHGTVNERWTEEFQEDIYLRTFEMFEKIEGFVGTSPWILADFRSPRRLLGEIQNEYNRKGVLSEMGVKKKAFYALQKYYDSKDPNKKTED